ncbi:DNA topoisomerase III [Pelagicoccus sp. NFK12]|uniref:DNA topoisomerase n=1 Tax=Pelagicoccus enzymogenes TaxID=2773457 RepID=A0A927II83_9BACT|nr:DNA topoisomerase III [Pelagicoccus enzymogenes]MBD5780493.1 DNA topoisomerase III [Pelagicoccus enzymogenes]MDQ8197607.1 DNA topoisomerase III [Pelagicoccus enzymogenes]
MKSLVIAEKPSVARDLCKAVGGKFAKHDEYFESDEYVITSAVGHIVELCMPEDYDKRDAFWRLANLPIIPEQFKLKPIEKTESKFKSIKKLMKRKDIGTVINACDAGREGELIFSYVYKLTKSKLPVKRLWMLSMTPAAIRQAFKDLRDGEEMQNLADAAQSRSEADWLIGINCTRGVTKRLYGSRAGNVAGVGRVQTPTLAIVVERERLIESFEPRDYWRIVTDFGITNGSYQGVYQKPDFKKGDDEHNRIDRIWDEEEANKIAAALEGNPGALVSEEKKKSRQAAQRLYDLTTLQREANNRFGFSARRTLQLAQSLYEKHKMITYPRTDSRALPEDYPDTVRSTLKNLESSLGEIATRPVSNNWINPKDKRVFNNKQVSDHFAIIPTPDSQKKLNDDEAKIYDMISRRFVSIFYPSAEFNVTTRISEVQGHNFKTEGKVLVSPGWLEVYGKSVTVAGVDDTLPALSEQDGEPAKAQVEGYEKIAEQTKPPPRYTEATLLSAMEGAGKLVEDDELADAMKEGGLGTPATRAQIIERLIAERYIERDHRALCPTPKAETLLDFLTCINAEVLTKPELTGEWEYKLHKIEDGELDREVFVKEIIGMTEKIVDSIKNFQENDDDLLPSELKSPIDGQPLFESMRAFKTKGDKKPEEGEKDTRFAIYKIIGNRKMEVEELKELLEKGKVGPIDNFRSKSGKPYSANLYLDPETHRVKFDFGNGDGDSGTVDFSTMTPVAKCPRTGGDVFETPAAYVVRVMEGDKETTPIRVSRKILDREIPLEQMMKLLTDGKTDLLDKFWSKRTKRPFDAYLTLQKSGQTKFEFPPRAAKKATKKAAKKAAKKVAETD